MKPFLAFGVLVCILSGCSGRPDTIEQAEAYAAKHGVMLSERTESKEQVVAERAFRYHEQSGVDVSIMQFKNAEAAENWTKLAGAMPISTQIPVTKGRIVFQVWKGPEPVRKAIVQALQ